MIETIYLIIIFFYAVLLIGIRMQNQIIIILPSMGIMVTGVYLLSDLAFLSNILTLAIGIINVSIGFYIFIQGVFEEMQ